DDPSLTIDETSVLVLKHVGPKGAPGMPEWGAAPVPARLLQRGVKDMVRISDARMSGTSYGTVVLHVAPESAVGGPLALVRDGDGHAERRGRGARDRGTPRRCRGVTSAGGFGGPSRGPCTSARSRNATAPPGRDERWGFGGPSRGPCTSARSRNATALPGRDE